LNRRVVVTGIGLVCGCGIGTDEVWRNLLAGKSGIGPITHFDPAAFDCRIAGEVRNFDPLVWVEKKELKKMGRFIQLALAASEFAMQKSSSSSLARQLIGVIVGVAEQFLANAGALHEEADVELIGHAHAAMHLHAFLHRARGGGTGARFRYRDRG